LKQKDAELEDLLKKYYMKGEETGHLMAQLGEYKNFKLDRILFERTYDVTRCLPALENAPEFSSAFNPTARKDLILKFVKVEGKFFVRIETGAIQKGVKLEEKMIPVLEIEFMSGSENNFTLNLSEDADITSYNMKKPGLFTRIFQSLPPPIDDPYPVHFETDQA